MRAFHVAVATILMASAANAEPMFSQFPADGHLQGAAVHPDYEGNAAMYRTMIRQGIDGGPNAGGYYTIIPIPCGTSCTVVEMVDLRNGSMIDFPIGGEHYYQLALDFDRDSRLIVADWKDPSDGAFNTCVRRFYEIIDGAFILLDETSRTVEDYAICSD